MKLIRHFAKQKKGGLAIIFAVVFPFVLSLLAIAVDGAKILTKRARLADALHEAALAIATDSSISPDEVEKQRLEKLMGRYLNAYLPTEKVTEKHLNIYMEKDANNNQVPIFSLAANIDVKTILPVDIVPAFKPTMNLTNQGKVRKALQDAGGQPADYVFVVDFSSSMNNHTSDFKSTRIELLKKVVKDITEKTLQAHPSSTFAIVPFDVGVPVKYPNGEGANPLGGDIVGCSFLAVQKPEYRINYDFWADKSSKLYKAKSFENALAYLDESRYDYFASYVLPSLQKQRNNPALTMKDLTNMGLCDNKSWATRSNSLTRDEILTCEKGLSQNPRFIFTYENKKLIEKEWEKTIRLLAEFKDTKEERSLLHIEISDLVETVNGMFDEKNIIVYPINYGAFDDRRIHTFTFNCVSAGADDVELNYPTSIAPRNSMTNAKQNTYLIEPTNDLSKLDEFQKAKVSGGTHSSSGLLRAVPEMLKGHNKRKVMIIISDGDDNDIHLPTRNMLHQTLKVCDRIRKGVKERTNATDVDIYFISVVSANYSGNQMSFWADNCTGKDNTFFATNYNDLMDKFIQIVGAPEETGFFHN